VNRFLASCLALFCASIAISSPCAAAPFAETSILVRHEDLDLSRPVGVKALHHRVELAINQLCVDASGPSPASRVDAECKANAWRMARVELEDAVARQQAGQATADARIVADSSNR
jgi:UrcA family protein